MKKTLTSLFAALTLMSAMPLYNVNAADNPDLQALAKSLGAETDHFNFSNFTRSDDFRPLNWDYFDDFYKTCTTYEMKSANLRYTLSGEVGASLGISIPEILSHNGVIKPSDIVSGVNTLSEIDFCDEADKYITLYQMLQEHLEFEQYYKYKLYSLSLEEQMTDILDMSERNMNAGRYFLIFMNAQIEDSSQITLTSVGIGITDGEWEFDGKKYNKCILTLDPNGAAPDSTPESPQPMPFKETTCIYINSETNIIYCPAYAEKGCYDFRIVGIDDDSLLNFKGAINPSDKLSDEIRDEVSQYYSLRLNKRYGMSYDVETVDANGNKKIFEPGRGPVKGKKLIIKSTQEELEEPLPFEATLPSEIFVIDESGQKGYFTSKEALYEIDDNKVKFTSDGNFDFRTEFDFNEGYYNFSPVYSWTIRGVAKDEVSVEVKDEGILIRSDSELKDVFVNPWEYRTGESGLPIEWQYKLKYLRFNAANDVMISLDENDQLYLRIDPDKDGKFDKLVQKGDYNSDGIIDGRDASAVLSKYAELSILNKNYDTGLDPNNDGIIDLDKYADFNNDNLVDARDASAILTYYAENSVE